jgi:hypothetical protein
MKATIRGVLVEGEPSEIIELIRALEDGATGTKARTGRAVPVEPRPRKQVSPATQETRRLQGTYLGLVGKLSKKDRLTAKQIVAEKGKEAAIAWARSQMAGGGD